MFVTFLKHKYTFFECYLQATLKVSTTIYFHILLRLAFLLRSCQSFSSRVGLFWRNCYKRNSSCYRYHKQAVSKYLPLKCFPLSPVLQNYLGIIVFITFFQPNSCRCCQLYHVRHNCKYKNFDNPSKLFPRKFKLLRMLIKYIRFQTKRWVLFQNVTLVISFSR